MGSDDYRLPTPCEICKDGSDHGIDIEIAHAVFGFIEEIDVGVGIELSLKEKNALLSVRWAISSCFTFDSDEFIRSDEFIKRGNSALLDDASEFRNGVRQPFVECLFLDGLQSFSPLFLDRRSLRRNRYIPLLLTPCLV